MARFVTREKRKHDNGNDRRPAPRPQATEPDDETDGEEGIHLSLEEFMAMGAKTLERGDAAVVARLHRDLAEARRKKNHWKQEFDRLNGELPEDAVVLTGPDAEAYKKLVDERKLDFDKLPSLVETFENDKATLTAENIKLKNNEIFAEYGKDAKYNTKAIAGAVDQLHLHAEMGDVTIKKTDQSGKETSETKRTLKVRKASDPKAPLVPFDEYVTKNADWLWPSLKAGSQQEQPPIPGFPNGNGRNATVIEQGPSTDGAASDPTSAFIQGRNAYVAAQPNPLARGAQQPRGKNPTQRQ